MDPLKSALVDYRKAEEMLKRTALCYALDDEPYNLIFLGDTGLDSRKKEIREVATNAADLFAYQSDRIYDIPAFPLPADVGLYRLKDKGLAAALGRWSVVRIIAPCVCHKERLYNFGRELSWKIALDLDKVVVLYTQDLSKRNQEAYKPTHRQVRIEIFSPEFCCGSIYSEEWLE